MAGAADDILIAYGGRGPLEPAANTAFHQTLLDDLTVEIGRRGWPGARFAGYRRAGGHVLIEIEPDDDGTLSLEGLRAFHDEQRRRREEERQVA